MGNVKELRMRIRSIKSISQITRAMEMVATTKLRRFQDKATASRPFADEIQRLVKQLAGQVDDQADRPLFSPRKDKKTIGCFVVTSDRGLCGSYNTNLLAQVHRHLDQNPGMTPVFFVYGRKGYTYLYRRGYQIERYFVDPPLEKMTFRGARQVAQALVDAFLAAKVDEVAMFYTAFKSMVRHVPTVETFLPLSAIISDEQPVARPGQIVVQRDYILEPSPAVIFDRLVPKYLETKIFNALMESVASEYAQRRIAMKNATDAANDMTKELKRTYNRVRQETITKELLDIVGGAEALR